jgi:RimJ/RimL family protein N-acetyltransferase
LPDNLSGPARNPLCSRVRLRVVVAEGPAAPWQFSDLMQHKGYGTSMLRALINLAWEELDLHKLWLIVRKDNRAAQAMYLKQGFDFEGVLRDEYHVGGRFHDMVRMAVLRPAGGAS